MSLDSIGVSTLPVAWEAVVMEKLDGNHKLLFANIDSNHDEEMELVLEVGLSTGGQDIHRQGRQMPTVDQLEPDFLYLGVVREVCR